MTRREELNSSFTLQRSILTSVNPQFSSPGPGKNPPGAVRIIAILCVSPTPPSTMSFVVCLTPSIWYSACSAHRRICCSVGRLHGEIVHQQCNNETRPPATTTSTTTTTTTTATTTTTTTSTATRKQRRLNICVTSTELCGLCYQCLNEPRGDSIQAIAR